MASTPVASSVPAPNSATMGLAAATSLFPVPPFGHVSPNGASFSNLSLLPEQATGSGQTLPSQHESIGTLDFQSPKLNGWGQTFFGSLYYIG